MKQRRARMRISFGRLVVATVGLSTAGLMHAACGTGNVSGPLDSGGDTLSSAKALTGFAIVSPAAYGDVGAASVTVTVPYGTRLWALVATFTTTGVSVKVGNTTQISGDTANDFSLPVTFVVTAADGSTASYVVTVAIAPESPKAIVSFAFVTPTVMGTVNETTKTVKITVPYGTNVTSLVATFAFTGTSVRIAAVPQTTGTTVNNFTTPLTYTVVGLDGSSIDYVVIVTLALVTSKQLTRFAFQSVNATATINEAAKTVSCIVPFGTNVTALVPTFSATGPSVKVGTTVQISGTTPQNFTGAVVYTAVAGNGSTADYTVTVTVAANPAKAFVSFAFADPLLGVTAKIDETQKLIALTVPFGTDVTTLIATFSTTGAAVTVGGATQVSGTTTQNFAGPVTYTVVAADTSTAPYVVTVTPSPITDHAFASFDLSGPAPSLPATIDEALRTIKLVVPPGTALGALVATFTTTRASVRVGGAVQASGVTSNTFTTPVLYTVVADDGSRVVYTVTVSPWPGAAAALAQSGQRASYDANPLARDDGALRRGVAWPSPRFVVGRGAEATCVTDNLTGLMWAGSSIGAGTWSGVFTTLAALTDCGHNDWRLPNKRELGSLIDYGYATCALPAGHPFAFACVALWSSTTYGADTASAWLADFDSGNTGTAPKTVPHDALAVRGTTGYLPLARTGQTVSFGAGDDGALLRGIAWPATRFAVVSQGITDALTGLTWGADANLMPTRNAGWDTDVTLDDGEVTWQHALDYVAKLNAESYLGATDWRLPNVHELQTLDNAAAADLATWLMAVGQGFTNVANIYWTSTSLASDPPAWAHTFGATTGTGSGVLGSADKTGVHRVWPVRGP